LNLIEKVGANLLVKRQSTNWLWQGSRYKAQGTSKAQGSRAKKISQDQKRQGKKQEDKTIARSHF